MDPGVYDSDDYDYSGWAAVPAIFLKQATVNPYWGDLVKGNIINLEFFQAKAKDAYPWLGAAGLITSALASSARTDTETWFSGFIGDDDLEGLKSIGKDGPILFPGWVAGWKTEADAIAYVNFVDTSDAKQKVNKVIFHVTNASVLNFIQCRLFATRLEGTVASNKEAEGIWRFEVTGKALNDQTIADWTKAKADAAASKAVVAAAVVVPAEGAPAEGAPAEGAPAEGAPAEGAPAEGAPAEAAPAEAS